MIEGLKVTVEGAELRDLCESRAEYHKSRSDAYASQIESMKSRSIEGMSYTNGDPIKALEDRKNQHDCDYSEMNFIASHIDTAESYLLGREDLVKLGITKSRY